MGGCAGIGAAPDGRHAQRRARLPACVAALRTWRIVAATAGVGHGALCSLGRVAAHQGGLESDCCGPFQRAPAVCFHFDDRLLSAFFFLKNEKKKKMIFINVKPNGHFFSQDF